MDFCRGAGGSHQALFDAVEASAEPAPPGFRKTIPELFAHQELSATLACSLSLDL